MGGSRAARLRCPCSAKAYGVVMGDSVEQLEGSAWDELVDGRGITLQRPYLRAMEAGASHGLGFRYAMFYDSDEPVGVATFQLSTFVGQPIRDLLGERSFTAGLAARWLGVAQEELNHRVIVCGNAFANGEHGYAFAERAEPDRVVASVQSAVAEIQRVGEPVSAVLFKEFTPSPEVPLIAGLGARGYSVIATGANLVLPLDPQWRSFDDYLGSLSSKYRVKAKRAYAKSDALTVEQFSPARTVNLMPRIEALYRQVLDRADYRLGTFPLSALPALQQQLGQSKLVRGYFLGDDLVGFQTALVDENQVEASLVGFDYGHNREHSIYPRMLYDYLRLGIERGKRRIDYGRTAGEIKSTVGAVPVETRCYLRHSGPMANKLVRLIAGSLRSPSFPWRRPFKKAWYDQRGLVA